MNDLVVRKCNLPPTKKNYTRIHARAQIQIQASL